MVRLSQSPEDCDCQNRLRKRAAYPVIDWPLAYAGGSALGTHSSWCMLFPQKSNTMIAHDRKLRRRGKQPYWKSPTWNVSVGTAGFFVT